MPTVCTKNRDRLLEADVARKFLAELLNHERVCTLLSDEHFSVDGTQVQAWASMRASGPRTVRTNHLARPMLRGVDKLRHLQTLSPVPKAVARQPLNASMGRRPHGTLEVRRKQK